MSGMFRMACVSLGRCDRQKAPPPVSATSEANDDDPCPVGVCCESVNWITEWG
jgi:hypothetical protein